MKQHPFGLDIGATTIKLVWLEPKNKEYSLKAAAIEPTPAKGMLSESPLDQEEMAHAIKKIVADAKVGIKDVTIALAENQVYTKVIEMPVLSDNELSSAIYWEAEQYIPVPLANITLDYAVLKRPDKSQNGGKMQVLMVGAPTSLIDKYQKIITMTGLNLVAVETEILSIVRALIPNNTVPPTIIINIGAVSTSIAIIRNGVVVFTYTITMGGNAISRAIASDFNFSLSQAEEYKKVYGLTSKTVGDKLGKSTEPIIAGILAEVKKAMIFYTGKYQNEDSISQILLTGGTAKLPGLAVYFAKNLNVETAIANPWKNLVQQNLAKGIVDNAVDYTIAAGLAMRSNGV